MTQSEIEILQNELMLRGVDMVVPVSVYHMDIYKALSVCLDLSAGRSLRQAIDTYDSEVG